MGITYMSIAALALAAVLVGVWAWRAHFSPAAKARRANARAGVAELREAALSGRFLRETPSPAGKAFAMDWQVDNRQLATLVSYDDGTTSLYLSSGGGRIGAGSLPSVQIVAERFRAGFAEADAHFQAVEKWPPPARGRYVFYAVDRQLTRATAHVAGAELRSRDHPLHSLAARGQTLITAIRKAKPNAGPGSA